MVTLNGLPTFSGDRLLRGSLLAAACGAAGTALGFWIAPRTTFFGYLTAFAFAASIALGSLIFLMISHVVGARWSVVLRRLNESIASVLPALALAFVPLAFGLRHIYLWTSEAPPLPEHELHILHHRQAYLNAPFFLVRTAAYFAIWVACAALLWRWSTRQDQSAAGSLGAARSSPAADPHQGRERTLSAALLAPVALALTFAAFDWLMSLEPLWSSTLFGVYYFAGGFVASFGLLSVLGFAARRDPAAAALIRPPHFHALGRLMFGFTVFWAYSAFFQAMLIYMANRPEEVTFYVHRTSGGFRLLTSWLVLSRFLLPFLVLLPRWIKFRPSAMAAIGVWIIASHYVDLLWLVVPSAGEQHALALVWYASALTAIVGACVAFACALLRGKPLVPAGDAALIHSAMYRSPS